MPSDDPKPFIWPDPVDHLTAKLRCSRTALTGVRSAKDR